MRSLSMKLTVGTKMAALQTSFEDFIKISDLQQCLLKLTDKIVVQVINTLKYFREGSCSLYLKLKLKEQFVKFPSEIMPCACNCRWSVGNHNHLIEIATHKFS